MLDDKEMQELFYAESQERLKRIEQGLMQLEKDHENLQTLQEIFREMHSLKGAARILNLYDIEILSHRMEDIFSAASKKKLQFTENIISVLYQGVNALYALVEEAAKGVPSKVVVSEIISQIKFFINTEKRNKMSDTPRRTQALNPANDLLVSVKIQENFEESPFKIETIRVEMQKIDILMNEVGELNVARFRIEERFSNLENILEKWEYLSKEIEGYYGENPSLKNHSRNFGLLLEGIKNKLYEDNARLDSYISQLEENIREIRLLPLDILFSFFQRMVRDMEKEQGKKIHFSIEGSQIKVDKKILEEMKAPLMHLLSNAIIHGIETSEEREKAGKKTDGNLILRAYQTKSNYIVIEVQDDGRGLDKKTIQNTAIKQGLYSREQISEMTEEQIYSLIFEPGLSTSSFITEVSGRGMGLSVVKKSVAQLKGNISLDSSYGHGCKFKIFLPVTMSTESVLIVQTEEREKYAIPVESVLKSFFVKKENLLTMEGRDIVLMDGIPISVAKLSSLVQCKRKDWIVSAQPVTSERTSSASPLFSCVVLDVNNKKMAILVDQILEEKEIVLKPKSPLIEHIPCISGSSILGTGEICLVLNPHELLVLLQQKVLAVTQNKKIRPVLRPKKILMVEDSITIRIRIKRILEAGGYEVIESVDGADAMEKLALHPIDAVVSDITMPNMDGLELTTRLRQDQKYKNLPVILLTMLSSEEDRKKGLLAGANAYISKPTFDQKLLLDTLKRVIPE